VSVNTTVFFTHCLKKIPNILEYWVLLLCWVLLVWPQGVYGQVVIPERFLTAKVEPPQVPELWVEREPDGLFLTAALPPLVLSSQMRTALDKGIPMVFTLHARVLRERWYWSDQVVAEARRYMRLSYQPLTRRWRLMYVDRTKLASGQMDTGLGQAFDDVSDAVAAMRRVVRWQIAKDDIAGQDSAYVVKFQFLLDVAQLPRLLQIGAAGHQGWILQWKRSMHVPLLGKNAGRVAKDGQREAELEFAP